jgi:hypothetical protein
MQIVIHPFHLMERWCIIMQNMTHYINTKAQCNVTIPLHVSPLMMFSLVMDMGTLIQRHNATKTMTKENEERGRTMPLR